MRLKEGTHIGVLTRSGMRLKEGTRVAGPCSIFLGTEIPSILRSVLSCKFRDGYSPTRLG